MGQSTCLNLFKEFCDGFSKAFYDSFVCVPESEQFKDILNTYCRVGFPGACGSMDIVYVRWDRCPNNEFPKVLAVT